MRHDRPTAAAAVHIFDDRGGEFGGAEFRRAGHQAFEIVGDALLLDGARDAVFDQPRRLPSSP